MTYNGINFNGTTAYNSYVAYYCNFTATSVWYGGRLLVLVRGDYNGNISVTFPTIGEVVYTCDSAGYAIVDITDFVRTYATDGSTYAITIANEGDEDYSIGLSIQAVGIIDPSGVLIPYQSLQNGGALIVPPAMMYGTLDQSGYEVAEFYATSGTWSVSGDAGLSSDERYIGQISGAFVLTNGTNTKTFQPMAMLCDHRYALVKWISFTGVERAHWFEVVKPTIATDGQVDILTLTDGYKTFKGREDGFTLKIEGLNAYDIWYYADVITSGNVQVSFDGSTFERVQVTTKNVTIPDGNADNGKIEIAVNYKHYDSVDM